MTSASRDHTTLQGPWAWLGPAAWLVVVGAAVTVAAMGFVRGFADPSVLRTPQVERVYEVLGVPTRLGMSIGLVVPYAIFTAAGLLVFWRRTRDWMALLFSATFVCIQTFTSVAIIAVLDDGGVAGLFATVVLQLAGVGLVAVLFLFPDGRIYPSWARWVAPLLAVAMVATSATVDSLALIRPDEGVDLQVGLAGCTFAFVVAMGMYAQFRRYRELSSEVERQQAKWVMFPFGMVTGYLLVALILPELIVGVSDAWLGWVMVGAIPFGVLFPITVTIAILRYRLYEIDVVISRTLVFAGLAAFITSMYLGIVVGVGTLLGVGDEGNVVLAVIGTAVVAVAFQPARARLTRIANRLVFGQRATPYEVLSGFASHLGDTVATEETLQRIADLLADGTRAVRAEVSLWIDERMRKVADAGGQPDGTGEPVTVEVIRDGELLGALTIVPPRGESVSPADRALVEDLAGQAGLLLRNVRLTTQLLDTIEQLRASRKRLVAAQDEQRRRLERDLHDGAQQQFIAVKLKAAMARQLSDRGRNEEAADLMQQVITDTDEGIQSLRDLAHGIYPPLLEAEGLTAAVSARAAKAPVATEVHGDGIGRFPREVEAAIYFCVLEAIQNVVKYADATTVEVAFEQQDARLRFTVRDDGEGFDPDDHPPGHGLSNMADRLDALAGGLDVRSTPGSGTTVTGWVPADRPQPVQPGPSRSKHRDNSPRSDVRSP